MNRIASTEARVLAAIEQLLPSARELLQALVRVPSPVGDEAAAQSLVRDRMEAIGLDIDSFDVDPVELSTLAAFNATPRKYAGRPCVVGTRRGAGGGRSLLLNAHIDTVPVDMPETWMHPPYGGEIHGDMIYGRGACDDKAGIVECLLVAEALRAAGVKLRGDFSIASVIEDESSGNGSLASVERGHTADGVIIVDGTWPERFIVSHMGHVSFRIHLKGVAGHATSPGPNPVMAIGHVVAALDRLVKEKNAEHGKAWGPREAPLFVNIGAVAGGVWPGSVPASCVIEGQFGFPPPMTCDWARRELQQVLAALSSSADWPLNEPARVEFAGLETPPVVGDPMNDIAQALTRTVLRRQGKTLVESVIAGHCDLRHYRSARRGATEAACLYGPGGGKNVHGNDESFDLTHLGLVAGNLACVALEWCGVAD